MDFLVAFRDFFVHMTFRLPEGLVCLVLRLGMLLGLTALLLFLALVYLPWRSVFSQVCVAFFGFVIALYLPVDMFREVGEGFLAFMFALSLLCMIFLPNFLPSLLTPKVGSQIKLRKLLKEIIWGLFLIQMIAGW